MCMEELSLPELAAPDADPSAVAAFCTQLQRDSFVRLRVPASSITTASAAAAAWFDQPIEEKLQQAGALSNVQGRHVGYAVEPGKRERLEVRLTRDGLVAPTMATALEPLLVQMERWGRALLRLIAIDLGHRPDAVDERFLAVKGTRATSGELQNSVLRVCKYETQQGADPELCPCGAHHDVGFLTLNPTATTPGLQAQRASDKRWVELEDVTVGREEDESWYCVVMVGKALADVDPEGRYRPTLHAVRAPPVGVPRISMPFLLRGPTEACRPASVSGEALAHYRVAVQTRVAPASR